MEALSRLATLTCLLFLVITFMVDGSSDYWKDLRCNEHMTPEDCDFAKIPLQNVEDYDRCAPAELPIYARNYFLGWAGRGVTYRENKAAFERIKIIPKSMRDTTKSSMQIVTLKQKVALPIGIAPTGIQKLAHPYGEKATAVAAADYKTVMILSGYSTTSLEDVANHVKGTNVHLWMQVYIYKDRTLTQDLVKRAENNGYKAIVLTVDSNTVPAILCDAKSSPEVLNSDMGNFGVHLSKIQQESITFEDIKWLKKNTKLPVVAKGILTGDDAQKAIQAGADAIMVSNHGGRQLDGVPAAIDALPRVVETVGNMYPPRDVYMDGGIRSGYDVFKAIARGAKMVFIGRPVIWGLTMEGENGIKKIMHILRREFNDTMILAGARTPADIDKDSVAPLYPVFE